jgi:hypothetical protein
MHQYLKTIEHLVDKCVPYALLLLVFILIIEFGFSSFMEHHPLIRFADYVILCVFIIDLCFKYYHSTSNLLFFRTYWLEIIACFPLFLVFRIFDALGWLGSFSLRTLQEGQAVLHATSAAERELVAAKLLRAEKLARFLRPIYGIARGMHVADFYTHHKITGALGKS